MSQRSRPFDPSAESLPALATLDTRVLAAVTGGLIGPSSTLDPVLLQGIDELSQAIVSVGQNLAAAKQSSTQQLMQMLEQFMQSRGGR